MGSKNIQNAVSAPGHSYVIEVEPEMLESARAKRAELAERRYSDSLARINVYYHDQQAMADKDRIWLADLVILFDCDARHIIRVAEQKGIAMWKAYKQGERGGTLAWATDMSGALTLAEHYARNTSVDVRDLVE